MRLLNKTLKLKKSLQYPIITILLFFIFLWVQNNILGIYFVNGDSMATTLNNNDVIVVLKTVSFINITTDDILVAYEPKKKNKLIVKRCVGIPGDTVFIKGSTVTVNSINRIEPFDVQIRGIDSVRNLAKTVLPKKCEECLIEDCYFVLGDNRYYSIDSRNWGCLPRNKIVGKMIAKLPTRIFQ